jgi:hypothetical protein
MQFLLLFLSFLVISSGVYAQEETTHDSNQEVIKLKRKHKKALKKQIKQLEQVAFNYQTIEMYQENERLITLLESRLKNNQVIGIELVIAAGADIRVESRWGHSMLRFVDNVRSANNDITLGFIADLETSKTNYLKGIIGAYPVFPILKTLGGFVEQYIKGEDRALERYVIPTTPQMRQELVQKLRTIWDEIKVKNDLSLINQAQKTLSHLERKQQKEKYQTREIYPIDLNGQIIGYSFENDAAAEVKAIKLSPKKSDVLNGYTFFKNNCAGALINFLRSTSFDFIGKLKIRGRIPNQLDRYLAKYNLTHFPAIVVPAIVNFKQQLEVITGKKYTELNDFEAWEKTLTEELLAQLTTSELMLMMNQADLAIPAYMQDQILLHLSQLQNKPNYDQLYQIEVLATDFYQLCQDTNCAKRQIDLALKHFSGQELIKSLSRPVKTKVKKSNQKYNLYQQYRNILNTALKEAL